METPLLQLDEIPPQMPVDPVNALLEVLRALPMQRQDPIFSRQSQLTIFVKARPPPFDGFQGPIAANQWLRTVRDTFDLLGTPAEYHVPFAAHKLSSTARTWWETIGYTYDTRTMTWEVFERLFIENYFNADHQRLEQGSMTVTNYYNRFIELAQYS